MYRLLWISAVFQLCYAPLQGNVSTDSLYQLVVEASNDSLKAVHYYNFLGELDNQNDERFKRYIEECLSWSKKYNAVFGLGAANYYLSEYYISQGNFQTALNHSKSAEQYFREVKQFEDVIRALYNQAFCYTQLLEWDHQERTTQIAFALAKKIKSDNIGLLYDEIANTYSQRGDMEKAENYIDSAIWHFQKQSNVENIANAMMSKALLLRNRKPNIAIQLFKEALVYLEGGQRPDLRSGILSQLASTYQKTGQVKEALEILYLQLHEAQSSNDKRRLMDAYIVLGEVHNSFANSEKSIEYYSKCETLADSLNASVRYALCIASQGQVFLNDESYNNAIFYLEKAIARSEHPYVTAQIARSMVSAYLKVDRPDQAFQSLSVIDSLLDYGHDLPFLRNIAWAEYYLYLKKASKAIPLCLESLDFARGSNNILLENKICELLYLGYQQRNDYKEAFTFLERHQILEDSINQDNHIKQITALDLTEQFEEEKERIAFENEKEMVVLKEKQKRSYILGLAALIILSILSVFYVLLSKRNKEIKRQKKTLESLNAVKDQLFQIIGHDLKKPSLAFRGIARNIDYLIQKGDLKRLQLLGKEIDRDAHQFYTLTDNLLNWASIQKDLLPIKPEDVKLFDIAEENIKLFASAIKRKNLVVKNEISPDIILRIDKNSLFAILRNLIDNAIKFTPLGGKINLKTLQHGDRISIEVEDSGIGIDPKKMELMMSKEYVHSTLGTNNEKGAGIGLNIVKNLVDKIEGKLNILSELDSGTSFIIDLPKKVMIS